VVAVFAPFGLGAGMHSVIGEGKVGEILSSSRERRGGLMGEAAGLGGFATGVLAIGVYPRPLTDLMEAPISQLVMQLGTTKLQGL